MRVKGESIWLLTCLSPRCVNAEHSIYLTALILFANFWPCSRFNGDKPCSDKALNVSLSSLKSILVPVFRWKKFRYVDHLHSSCRQRRYENVFCLPTKIIGASGQWCFISGCHFDVTFSNEDGLRENNTWQTNFNFFRLSWLFVFTWLR